MPTLIAKLHRFCFRHLIAPKCRFLMIQIFSNTEVLFENMLKYNLWQYCRPLRSVLLSKTTMEMS